MSEYMNPSEESIKMDLAYLGQHEARYVQKQIHIVLSKTNNLLNLLHEDKITPDYLHYWLCKYRGPYTNEQGTAHYIVNTYKEIYETLANRIRHSLRRPLGVPLPALIRWLLGSDGVAKERDWRNIIAHNAGVPAPYERSDEDQIVNRRFDPARFLDESTPILQDLKEDLESFLSWLDQDIDHYPTLELEEPIYDPYNEQDFLRELEAERHQHIIQLQAEQARLEKRAEHHREEAARTENFYLTLAKDMSEELRQQARDTEAKMYDVCAQKSARVKQIWCEREEAAAESGTQWVVSESDQMSESSSWNELDEFDWEGAGAQWDADTELDGKGVEHGWHSMSGESKVSGCGIDEILSTSSLAGVASGVGDAGLREADGSLSIRRVVGRLLKDIAGGVETAVRCQQVGEGLLAGAHTC